MGQVYGHNKYNRQLKPNFDSKEAYEKARANEVNVKGFEGQFKTKEAIWKMH